MKIKKDSGQASLEMTAALIVVMMLLVGAVRLFAWLNAGMVYRQAAYEQSHVAAGDAPFAGVTLLNQGSTQGLETYNESAYPKLNLFE